jgi:3-oxoacyl-[acyl-carrier-protein] synthase I
MEKLPRIYIAGAGMISGVGSNMSMNATAIVAGIGGYSDSSTFSRKFKAMKMLCIPDEALPPLDEEIAKSKGMSQAYARMIRAIGPAMKDCLGGKTPKQPIPLFLALPEGLPGVARTPPEGILKGIATQTKIPIDLSYSRQLSTGRTGGLQAIDMATRYLMQTGNDFAFVAGLDSPLDQGWLAKLDYEDRILQNGAKDAFAPGEAAACLLLATERGKLKFGLRETVWCTFPGHGDEPGHRYSDEPYLGEGMASAFQKALQQSDSKEPIKNIFSTLNGESFGAKELGVALTRNNSALDNECSIQHPADVLGDIGAASAPAYMGIIAFRLLSNRLKGRTALLVASDSQYRSAITLQITR